MDGDERLVLGPLHLVQILGCLTDEGVEDVEELVVSLRHDLAVQSGVGERVLRVAGPDHLQAQDTDLGLPNKSKM